MGHDIPVKTCGVYPESFAKITIDIYLQIIPLGKMINDRELLFSARMANSANLLFIIIDPALL